MTAALLEPAPWLTTASIYAWGDWRTLALVAPQKTRQATLTRRLSIAGLLGGTNIVYGEEIRELCNKILIEKDLTKLIPAIDELRKLLTKQLVEIDVGPAIGTTISNP